MHAVRALAVRRGRAVLPAARGLQQRDRDGISVNAD
jgi:hypothetical protein